MTTIGASGGGNQYAYGIHSPTTDRIYQALEDLEKQEKAAAAELEKLPAKARADREVLPGLGKHVGRFKKKEMAPEVLRVYEKQFRGAQLENYGMIKDAAKKELEQNESLSPENRRQLIKAINEADKRIVDISTKFYETHPRGDEFRLAPGEEVNKVLIEEKLLIESRVKIILREKKKNEAQQQQLGEKLLEAGNLITHNEAELNRIRAAGDPNNQAAALEAKLSELRSQVERQEGELKTLKLANDVLQGQAEACVDRLNRVLKEIADIKGEKQEALKSREFLSFISDEILETPAKGLLGLVEAYKLGPKEGEGALNNLGVAVLSVGRDLIIARGRKNRWKILKEKVIKHIIPLAGIYVGVSLIYAYGPAVIAGLGTAMAAAKAFFIASAAVIGITNPVGAVILGIAVSGVAIYGLGLLISRNKAYIVKAFTPLTFTAKFLFRGLKQLYMMVKNKVSPDLHVSLKLKPLPEGSEKIKDQLEYIADQAKLSAERAKLNGEMQRLVKQFGDVRKRIKDLPDQMHAKGVELLAVLHANRADKETEKLRLNNEIEGLNRELAQAKEDAKKLQKQIQNKEFELAANHHAMVSYQSAKNKVNELKPLALEFPQILAKIGDASIPEAERQQMLTRLDEVTSGIKARFEELKKLVGLEDANAMLAKAEVHIPSDLQS